MLIVVLFVCLFLYEDEIISPLAIVSHAVTIIVLKFSLSGSISIGNDVQINDMYLSALESIYIGNDVLVGSRVFVSDHNHGTVINT